MSEHPQTTDPSETVVQAKHLVMEMLRFSEPQAHHVMRMTAMNTRRTTLDVANDIMQQGRLNVASQLDTAALQYVKSGRFRRKYGLQ